MDSNPGSTEITTQWQNIDFLSDISSQMLSHYVTQNMTESLLLASFSPLDVTLLLFFFFFFWTLTDVFWVQGRGSLRSVKTLLILSVQKLWNCISNNMPKIIQTRSFQQFITVFSFCNCRSSLIYIYSISLQVSCAAPHFCTPSQIPLLGHVKYDSYFPISMPFIACLSLQMSTSASTGGFQDKLFPADILP